MSSVLFASDFNQKLGSFDMAYPDNNNNSEQIKISKVSVTVGEKYSLRPRSLRKGLEVDEEGGVEILRKKIRGGTKQKEKQKPAPLSKYRRKTANARERSRMREMNAAFEALRRCVPMTSQAPVAPPPPQAHNEKLTKITTLRLAMKYISALSGALRDADASTSTDVAQTPQLSLCHLLEDPSLLFDSDGDSLHLHSDLSDHSLTPQDFSPTSVDFPDGTLSTVFGEDSLSPMFPDQSLSPFEPFFSDFT